MGILPKYLGGIRAFVRGCYTILKGSRRDPFLSLGIVALILFVSIEIMGGFTITRPALGDIKVLSTLSAIITERFNQPSFLMPIQKIREAPDLSFFNKNSLAAVSPPMVITPQALGVLIQGGDLPEVNREIMEYTIESGDTLWSLSEEFNVSLNTILWANDLNQNSVLQPGQKLIILPISGVIHHVQNGDTISDIARTYQVGAEKIIAFNELPASGDIYIGDILIIPDGVMPIKPSPVQYVPLASSYFICPIGNPCGLTQGLHWYNAVDLSQHKCGTPVFAAAAGKVLKIRLTNSTSQWAFGGAGNHMTILHPNGVVTYYGHIAASTVSQGDSVSQGQIIGYVGGAPGTAGAGYSTGCHLHFGVQGAKNPFAK